MLHFQAETLKKGAVLGAGLWCAVGSLILNDAWATQEPEAPPAAITVFDVSGQAEVMEPSSRAWSPLLEETALKGGSKVRTGKKGSVHIVFDKNLATGVKLDKSSQLVLGRTPELSVFLEKGRLFVLREEAARGVFEIRSRHLKVRMGIGGCLFDATKKGILVRVYGDDVVSEEGVLQEGHKFWRPSAKKESSSKKRMVYADTVDWQVWVRRWYEMRDDYFAERLEKEMG